jgi:hypothetical protein
MMHLRGLTSRKTYAVLALLVFFSSLFIASSLFASTAHAWNPGRIIDDTVFYDSGTMSVGQIQAFLDSKVPSCDTNGTKEYRNTGMTRAEWSAANGKPTPPYTCLKDFRQTTSNKSSDGMCSGHVAGNKSAAEIIYEAARSCGVNPKVLLVLLQKEQSLITDDWPWPVQYNKATGFFCPDDPNRPGWCHPDFGGFFNQVYHAARQYKVYRAHPHNYNHIARVNNNILYNPNASCGSSTVFIENQATAGLYNYTPYQPNQAILNGSPDSCSSYGNYNFWNLFRNWFGSTTGPERAWETSSITVYADAAHTQRISDGHNRTYISPGQKLHVRAEVKNIGRVDWPSNVRLGTSGPRDRASSFEDDSWISNNRVVGTTESSTPINNTATFEFAMTAPNTPGRYIENFNLVQDGVAWYSGRNLRIEVAVSNPASVPPLGADNMLQENQQLKLGQNILSPDKNSTLWLHYNGNLILAVDNNPVWSSGTANKGVVRAVMQSDGNLVLYNSNGQAVWAAATNGPGATRLVMQHDGNLVMQRDGTPIWHTATSRFGSTGNRTNYILDRGHVLLPGQALYTPDRKFRLIMQHDGNLVLYSPNRATWASNTGGTPRGAGLAVFQRDGNFVVYDKTGRAVWASNRGGQGGSALVLQPDGNLVSYSSAGPTWASHTGGVQ